VQVRDGDAYIPGEQLLVMLYGPKDNGLQYVFEASNAEFVGGGCEKRNRVANANLAKLNVPTDASGDITIIAGWALGYDNVKITPVITLVAPVRTQPAGDIHEDAPSDTGATTGAKGAEAIATDSPPADSQPVQGAPSSGQVSEPAQPLEPIKLNLRGAQPPPSAVDKTDAQQAAPDRAAPIKLSVGQASLAAASDPSEPETAKANNAPAASDVKTPQTQDTAFVKPPLVRQKGLTDLKEAADNAAPPPAAEKEPEIVEDVDAAIDKMQDVLKQMQKKRAEHQKTTGKEGKEGTKAHPVHGGVKVSVKEGAGTKKKSVAGVGDIKKRKTLQDMAFQVATGVKRAKSVARDPDEAEEGFEEGGEEGGEEGSAAEEEEEGERSGEEVLGEVLSAKEARMRRSKGKGEQLSACASMCITVTSWLCTEGSVSPQRHCTVVFYLCWLSRTDVIELRSHIFGVLMSYIVEQVRKRMPQKWSTSSRAPVRWAAGERTQRTTSHARGTRRSRFCSRWSGSAQWAWSSLR
jgi:hypothetical protein